MRVHIQKRGILWLVLIFLISSCNNSGVPTIEYHSGTNGLIAEFKQVPTQLVEGQPFYLVVAIENDGAKDIRQGVFVINTLQDYIILDNANERGTWFGTFNLKGRSLINGWHGEKKVLNWKGYAGDIGSHSSKTEVPLGITFCYEYETQSSPTVCIDTDPFNEFVKTRSCSLSEYSSVSTGGGQGAPISVSRVEASMVKSDEEDFIIPQFKIYVSNDGGGEVVAQNQARDVCAGRPKGDVYDTIQVNAKLGDDPLVCTKQSIRVKTDDGDEDFVQCMLEQGISKKLGSYLTPLQVSLKYGYVFTINENVEIQKERQ